MFQNACINYQQLLNKLEEAMLKNHLLTQQYNDLFQQMTQVMEENKILHEKNKQAHERFNAIYSRYGTLYQNNVRLQLDLEKKQTKLQEKKNITKKLLTEITASRDEIEVLENILNFPEDTDTGISKTKHVPHAKSRSDNLCFFSEASTSQAPASSYTHTLNRAASIH